jgi:ABC-type lipoprotein release transport system permease subunit
MNSVAFTYALRSLARHPRRSLLSVLGVGIGCAICLFQIAWVRGERTMMMNAAASGGVGHLCVVPDEWAETRQNHLRLKDWQAALSRIRSHPDVLVATPRVRSDALLAFGTRAVGVSMAGVDPVSESAANRLVQHVTLGGYLADAADTVVIGQGVAKQLDVRIDDELMVTVAGRDGELRSAMLRVVGIVATGSRELDASICHARLADVGRLAGQDGATELVILLRAPRRALAEFAEELAGWLPADSVTLTWEELRPELAAGIEVDETWANLTVGIIMLLVFFGIASAQLAAVLERRREFAVLASLGMPGGHLLRIMLVEGVLLGLVGAGVGLIIGGPFTWWIATRGIDFGKLFKMQDMTMSGILIDPVFYADFGWFLLPLSLGLALVATLLSSLYPAWYAIRTDPANAIRIDA